jgi:hypothetical protein
MDNVQKCDKKKRKVSFYIPSDINVKQSKATNLCERKEFFSGATRVFELVGDNLINSLLLNLSVVDCNVDIKRDEESRKANDHSQAELLLLLRHTYKCEFKEGHCPYTPFCHGVQFLWAHIMNCRMDCTVSHCASSKRVLYHYMHCLEGMSCSVCRPMREAIKRNFERYALKLLCLQCGDKV